MTSEDISEHREYIIHVHTSAETSTKSACALRPIEPKLVILLTFLWISEHIVSFSSFFEFLFSFFVPRVSVRMKFDGYLAISHFYFIVSGSFLNTKYLVVISLLSHNLFCLIIVLQLLLRV